MNEDYTTFFDSMREKYENHFDKCVHPSPEEQEKLLELSLKQREEQEKKFKLETYLEWNTMEWYRRANGMK